MIKSIWLYKHIFHLFGRHDIIYQEDESWGRCTICRKLFCHTPFWWFATITRETWKMHGAELPNAGDFWIYTPLEKKDDNS